MMRKLLLCGLIVLAVLVVSCAPGERGPFAGEAINQRNLPALGARAEPCNGVQCPQGQFCNQNNVCERKPFCNDNDVRNDVYVKGTVTSAKGNNQVLPPQFDSCTVNGGITQVNCGRAGTVESATVRCLNGCRNGACVTCDPVTATECTAGRSCPANIPIPPLGFKTVKLARAQPLSQVSPILTKADLPILLADGTLTTNEGITFAYEQKLKFDYDARSGYVDLLENDNDLVDNFFFIRGSGPGPYPPIATYDLKFTQPADSDITDNTGTADVTGMYLDDFEGTTLNLLGKSYTVVQARRTNADADLWQFGTQLTLMTGGASDTLLEGEFKVYPLGDHSYEVRLISVDRDQKATFQVSGQETGPLQVGEFYALNDHSKFGISNVLYQDYAGGVHSATFFLAATILQLRDDRVTDTWGRYNVKVGSEDIDGTIVRIVGSDDNRRFSISSISINMTPRDDYFVAQGEKLTDAITFVRGEKELLFTNNWDILFRSYNQATGEAVIEIGKIC